MAPVFLLRAKGSNYHKELQRSACLATSLAQVLVNRRMLACCGRLSPGHVAEDWCLQVLPMPGHAASCKAL